MTSKNFSMNDELKNCYVYLDTGETPKIVAQFSFEKPVYSFLYGQSYLTAPSTFPIDPLNLPFKPNNEVHTTVSKDGFGVLADATPDNWGRRLTLTTHNRTPLNQLEWLISAQGTAVGCLVASLSKNALKKQNKAQEVKFSDLSSYIRLARAVEEQTDPNMISFMTTNYLEKLIHHGSSMGGARPKIIVKHNDIEWIAKFNKKDDLFDNARVEYACMKMAEATGINTSQVEFTEVEGSAILMVKRFDRNCPERKKHYISSNSLMNIQKTREGDPRMSYMGLSTKCALVCHDAIGNQKELFKRMVLNVMLSNTDDHLKNHGFLMYDMDKQRYSLSPAFDVLPHGSASSFPKIHAIGLGEDGRIGTFKNIMSSCSAFGITSDEAIEIMKDVRDVLENRTSFFKDLEMSDYQINQLDHYFNLDISEVL